MRSWIILVLALLLAACRADTALAAPAPQETILPAAGNQNSPGPGVRNGSSATPSPPSEPAGERGLPADNRAAPKPPRRTLRVAVLITQPFAMVTPDGRYRGFAVELWELIARHLSVDTQYQSATSVEEVLQMVSSNRADVGIGAISVTAERDKIVDFTQPICDGGLTIAIPYKGAQLTAWQRAVLALWQPDMIHLPILFLILIIVPSHFVWIFERNHEKSIVARNYIPGIFDAGYWAASTLSTQAENMPRSAIGRVIAVVWMFCGILFTSYFTAVVTTSMAMVQLQAAIHNSEDLIGKTVATINDSTSQVWLQEHEITAVVENSLEAAMRDLQEKRAQAVLFDAPTLRYYAEHEGKGRVKVVGGTFERENYSIVVHEASPLRKLIDAALLSVSENGTYNVLYVRWFGAKS